MTIRRNVSIFLLGSALIACIGEGDGLDAAVIDGAAADAGDPEDAASLQAGLGPLSDVELAYASSVPAAVKAVIRSEAANVPTMPAQKQAPSNPAIAAEVALMPSATESAAALPAVADIDESDGLPVAGTALAVSIDGIRALVQSLDGGAPEHGPLRILEHEGSVLALAKVSAAALDPASRAWLRRSVRVLTSTHQSCAGRVAALELASPWIWKGELFDAEEPPSRADMEETIGGMLSSVVAHVVLDGGKPCHGRPLLVQDAAQPRSRVARTLRTVPRQRQVLEAFRSLPRYRALQAECEQRGECYQDEETGVPAGRSIELTAFQFPGDSKVYVVASMAAETCSEWGPPLSAIFTLGPSRRATPTLYRVNEDAELGAPRLMLDRDGDGQLEFVTYRFFGDLELIEEQGASRQFWSTYFVGCGC